MPKMSNTDNVRLLNHLRNYFNRNTRTINVKKSDIGSGVREDCHYCPIANACFRDLKINDIPEFIVEGLDLSGYRFGVAVDGHQCEIGLFPIDGEKFLHSGLGGSPFVTVHFDLPCECVDFVSQFDEEIEPGNYCTTKTYNEAVEQREDSIKPFKFKAEFNKDDFECNLENGEYWAGLE